jgi:uncharacterized protein HemX
MPREHETGWQIVAKITDNKLVAALAAAMIIGASTYTFAKLQDVPSAETMATLKGAATRIEQLDRDRVEAQGFIREIRSDIQEIKDQQFLVADALRAHEVDHASKRK